MPFVSPRPLSVLGARVCRSARGRVALCKVPSISLARIWLSCRLWFNSELGLVRSWPGIGSGFWERLRFCRSVPARRLLCQLRWRVRLGWTWLAAANRSDIKLWHYTANHGMLAVRRGGVCGAKRLFRQILSGGNGELRHLFCAFISAPREGRGRAFSRWSGLVGGLDQLLHPDKKAQSQDCRNDAAGIRPAGAATDRYGDCWCGRRRSARLCVNGAAQAEAEVERSEGEGEAQGRPVVGGRRACEERAVRRSAGVRVGGWSGGRLVCL